MKYPLLVLMLCFSCGKKDSTERVHIVSPASLAADSDGDGMLDWDELYVGRDPYLADLDEQLAPLPDEVTLIDQYAREHQMPIVSYRTLRMALLQKTSSAGELPLDNRQIIRMDQAPEFWQARLHSTRFKKIRLNAATNIIMNPDLGHHEVLPKATKKQLEAVQQNTYRLVVSTPATDKIFHLTPQISPRDFLEKNFKIEWDAQNRPISIDGHKQDVEHTESLDYQADISLWRSVEMPLDLSVSPQAGKTYALVFGTAQEFKVASLSDSSFSHPQKILRPKATGHALSFVVFIPKTNKLRYQDKFEALPIRVGNGDRERTCEYTQRNALNYDTYILKSAQDLLQTVHFSGAQKIQVDWFENGTEGAAAKISMHLVGEDFSAALHSAMLPVGVLKSTCGDHKPVKMRNLPLWQEQRGHFSWLPQS